MARETVFVSDLTGKMIDEKDAATVTIKYGDARRGQVVLDVNASEVPDLAAKGVKQARLCPRQLLIAAAAARRVPLRDRALHRRPRRGRSLSAARAALG
jgi:hypothetical protein